MRATDLSALHRSPLADGLDLPALLELSAGLEARELAAGELLFAEGIGMAMQSAWLLCRHLLAAPATTEANNPPR
jgi:hypothetical protein